MPTVKTYGQRQVMLAPIPGVRKQAHLTAEALGAGTEVAKSRASEEMGAFGATAARIGLQQYAEIREQGQKYQQSVQRLELSNQMSQWKSQQLFTPGTGALYQEGKNSFHLPEEVGGEFDQYTGELEATISDPETRLWFANQKLQEGAQIDLTLRRHVLGESQKYEAEQTQALKQNKANEAIVNALDESAVTRSINDGVLAIQEHAGRMGQSPDAIKDQVRDYQSAVLTGVIDRLITNDQTTTAQKRFTDAKEAGLLDGKALDHLEKALDTATTAKTGLDASTDLWRQYGPKADTDPINLDAMEDAAREQFKDDPKALDATTKYLRERKAAVDASRQDRLEQRAGTLWTSASQGASLADIQRTPEYRALPGKQQAAISDYIVSRAEHDANRKYADEGRAYTERQRAQSTLEQRGWTRYWELSDPRTLSKMSDNGLQMLRGELGDEHVNRLLEQKRKLEGGTEKVHAATIDDDLFKTIAQSAGLKAYGSSTDEQKGMLGQLKNAVETEIDREQQRTGKPLTRDEKERVMQKVIDPKVMLHYSLWPDESRIAATVTNADDRARAYVPLANVPPMALSQFLNYARGLSPDLQHMPEPELRSRFSDRIQHAYALRMMGATRAEIEAAMKGQ
jgi:hypothetical protein